MANLIDFDDPQKSQNSPCASNKLFGVIKRECFAVEVAGMDDGVGETLQPGILIQIIPDYRGDQCHFKIRNFTNWHDKYKTVIYKCKKDDFIVVTGELWPYLLALKNDEGRVKLVQNVYNKEFDLNMVKLGSEIRIRGPHGSMEKYYEFRVVYNGVVKEIGTGYYIGLQLKNDGISLTSDLKCLSRYYRFGGTTGIVVPLDWIMLNLYKEEYYEPSIIPLNKVSSDFEKMIIETAAEAQENSSENVQGNLPIIEQQKKMNESGVPKIRYSTPNCVTDTSLTRSINVQPMKSFETRVTSKQSGQLPVLEEITKKANYGSKNTENYYVLTTPTIVQPSKTIETGDFSKQLHQSPEGPKAEFNNNADIETMGSSKNVENNYVRTSPEGPKTECNNSAAIEIETMGFHENIFGLKKMKLNNDGLKNVENNYVRTSPTTEIGIMPRQHHQPPENPSYATSNYVAEIESINNADGAVRNVEITKCDLCSKTVEIGHGIILRECLHSFCTRCITVHVVRNFNCSMICCPYKKYYECKFNLQDAEINDLGGETIYNAILKNRLNEYVGTDPNATMCPNTECGCVWVNIPREHQNYGRCPKCNVSWCFRCQSAHEPGEQHGSKSGKPTLINKLISKVLGTNLSEPNVACAKCHKTNISGTEYFRLENCNHTICKTCILPKIKSQTSGSKHAQCIVCDSYLKDKELVKIAGLEVLNLFLGNRKIQNDNAVLQEMCKCGPSVSNCSVELKCAHKFCRTYIVDLVQEQYSSSHHAACPRCLQEIDKSQLNRLVPGLIKEEIIGTCKMCPNKVDVYLAKCKHGFCHKCIRVMITKQVYDPSEKNVTCSSCHEHVTDGEISNYGGNEIFLQYQSKFEAHKLIPQPVSPTIMCVCRPPNVNCGFILKCGHTFCRTFIAGIVEKQLNSKHSAVCPTCYLEIDKIEIGHLDLGQIKNDLVTKCQNCSNQAGVRLTNCQHEFCVKCLHNIITREVFDPKKQFVTCTSCDKNVTDREISTHGSEELFARYKTKFGATPKPVDQITLTEKPFECDMCEKQIPIKGGIILAGCSHWFCIECCKEFIDRQLSIRKQPVCSLCEKELSQYEIEALIGKPTEIPPNDNSTFVECLKCEQKFDERLTQKCSKCANLICLKCAKATFMDQIRIGATPSCPVCHNTLDKLEISSITNGISSAHPEGVVHNEFDSTHSAEIPFECIMCEQLPDLPDQQIILMKCKHQICFKCLKELILAQMKWTQIPKCPVCQQFIDPIQLVGFGFSKVSSRAAVELEEPNICFVCKHRIQQKVVLKNCGHQFCGQCIQQHTTKQKSNEYAPSCPTCRKLIKYDQLLEFQSLPPISRTYDVQQNSDSKTRLQLNKNPFDCVRCDKMIDSECGIALINCEHLFCRDCISNIILERSKNKLIPICPLCETQISVEEIHALGSEVNAVPNEDQLGRVIPAQRHEVETERRDGPPSSDIYRLPICVVCNEPKASYALSICNDRFCHSCIKNVLNNQSLNNELASCPVFRESDR